MKREIDCLFVGHNEMEFADFERTIREMGEDSGAYRDLSLNYFRYHDRPYSLPDIYNMLTGEGGNGPVQHPLSMGETFHAAIAYLGTYLSRRGLSFDFVNAFKEGRDDLARLLTDCRVRAVAIVTTLYVTALPIVQIIEFVRRHNPDVKIIVGGPFVSTQCRTLEFGELEYLLGSIGADIYVDSSQGETALVRVLEALRRNQPLTGIPNVLVPAADGDGFTAGPKETEDNRLGDNMVDWSLFKGRLGPYANIRTSISCPFSCSFCGFPEHAGKYQTATVDEVIAELDSLNAAGEVRSIHVIDDTFNVPANRFKDLLRAMAERNYPWRWHSHFRCQFADREMVELMKQCGCEGVFLGIESGSDRILGNMNKKATVADYHRGIQLLKEYDIPAMASFIVGFPGETDDTVRETIQFIQEAEVDFFRAQVWYCETVTPIWRARESYGIDGRNFQWRHDTMNNEVAADWVDRIFHTLDSSTWVPQYNFDFDNLFHLTHRGMDIPGIKRFLDRFNAAVREKNAGVGVMQELMEALGLDTGTGSTGGAPKMDGETNEQLDVDFNF